MIDLDSNPTKVMEVVEIGKQLLMTRGALTTFSIANDVAKYFAIIPALFIVEYPELQRLNVMHLATPQSAILSAVIFNALIIIALIPLALRGVKYRPVGAAAILTRNLFILRLRRRDYSVHRHQGYRHHDCRVASRLRVFFMKTFTTALMATAVLTILHRIVYPIAVWGLAQAIFPHQAGGASSWPATRSLDRALSGRILRRHDTFRAGLPPRATRATPPTTRAARILGH